MDDQSAQVFPPWEFILEEARTRGWDVKAMLDRLGWGPFVWQQLRALKFKVDEPLAEDLSRVFGTTADYWLRMQALYDRRADADGGTMENQSVTDQAPMAPDTGDIETETTTAAHVQQVVECGARRAESVCVLAPGHQEAVDHFFGRSVRTDEIPQGLSNASRMLEEARREAAHATTALDEETRRREHNEQLVGRQDRLIRRLRRSRGELIREVFELKGRTRDLERAMEHNGRVYESINETNRALRRDLNDALARLQTVTPDELRAELRAALESNERAKAALEGAVASNERAKAALEGAVASNERAQAVAAEYMKAMAQFEDGPPADPRADAAQMSAADAYRLVQEAKEERVRGDTLHQMLIREVDKREAAEGWAARWKAAAKSMRHLYHRAVDKGCADRDFWMGQERKAEQVIALRDVALDTASRDAGRRAVEVLRLKQRLTDAGQVEGYFRDILTATRKELDDLKTRHTQTLESNSTLSADLKRERAFGDQVREALQRREVPDHSLCIRRDAVALAENAVASELRTAAFTFLDGATELVHHARRVHSGAASVTQGRPYACIPVGDIRSLLDRFKATVEASSDGFPQRVDRHDYARTLKRVLEDLRYAYEMMDEGWINAAGMMRKILDDAPTPDQIIQAPEGDEPDADPTGWQARARAHHEAESNHEGALFAPWTNRDGDVLAMRLTGVVGAIAAMLGDAAHCGQHVPTIWMQIGAARIFLHLLSVALGLDEDDAARRWMDESLPTPDADGDDN